MEYLNTTYKGEIYHYSKEEKEGYEKHTSTTGNVSYRKYLRSVEGELGGIEIKKNQFKNDAEEIYVYLGDSAVIFSLYMNDDFDVYAESLIRFLPSLKINEKYKIGLYNIKKGDVINGEEAKYNNRGVYIHQDGEKLKPSLSYSTSEKEGDIPALDWKQIAGKNRPTALSKEKRLDYLYNVLEAQVERLKFTESSVGVDTKDEPKAVDSKKEVSSIPSDDDLPF